MALPPTPRHIRMLTTVNGEIVATSMRAHEPMTPLTHYVLEDGTYFHRDDLIAMLDDCKTELGDGQDDNMSSARYVLGRLADYLRMRP